MKKLLLFVVVTALVAAAVWGGAKAVNDRYQEKLKTEPAPVKTITQSESDKKVANAKSAAAAEYQALVDRFNQQTVECQKGEVAHGKLTAAARNQTPRPLCAPVIETARQ